MIEAVSGRETAITTAIGTEIITADIDPSAIPPQVRATSFAELSSLCLSSSL